MKLKKILNEVLIEISPKKEFKNYLESEAKSFILELKKKGIHAEIGGSLAKGTMIKTSSLADVDIFVVFEKSENMKILGEILNKMKLSGKLKVVHGSRDYYQINYDNFILELIPVIKTKHPTLAENVTDASLSHVKYVMGEIKKNPTLASEIMIAKAFTRANKVYGAESYVNGFSGYALEVLIIHFGSFENFLKQAGKKRVIDPLKHFTGEAEVMRELNESKLHGPLILIDPTNKYRNVTAGLSNETYARFLSVARNFLRSPRKDFFDSKELNVSDIKKIAKKEDSKFIEIIFSTNKQEGDIAGTKMKKVFDFITREIRRKEQNILVKEFVYSGIGQTAKGYLVVKLKKEIIVSGPSRGLEEAAKKFKKVRGKSAFLKGKKWYAKEGVSIKKILKNVKDFEKDMSVEMKFKVI